jgi:hypothetical protein
MALRDALGRFLSPKPVEETTESLVVDGNFLNEVWRYVEEHSARVAPREDDPRLKELRRQGWTEDGIDLLLSRGNDPLKAAQQYEAEHPPPTAVASSGSRWHGLVVPPA